VPLLRQMPGVMGYYLLDGGPDVFISIRIFDTADGAFAANARAANWIRDNVPEFIKGCRKLWWAML
jgi:hypothetical protein